jgi:hypothetical protein
MEKIENKITVETLKSQLESAGINTAEWGTGQAKTLAHLVKEIDGGETILVTNEVGELLRKVTVGGADIYYVSSEGKKYRLKEEKQIFKDGRERRRDLGQAVSEKMKPSEDPKEAMIRGIQEELGISGEIILEDMGTEEKTTTSPSYPGLKSQYINYKFRTTLNSDQFNPDGYIEEQTDKSTYFIWEEIE